MSAARTPRVTRRRARAPRGSRAVGAVPRNRGPVTTLLAGLSLAGMTPAMTVEGGTTAAVFRHLPRACPAAGAAPRAAGGGRQRRRAQTRPGTPAGRGRRLPTGVPARLLPGP